MTRRFVIIAVATLLAGCGGAQSGGSVTPPASTAASSPSSPTAAVPAPSGATGTMVAVAEVNATGMGGAFNPASVSIHAGDSVEWTNKSGNIHNVTFAMPAVHSPVMFAGENWSQTFSTPGTFHYVCTYHPGMEGTVIAS